ncbi:MAG: hypothetical protein QM760_07290 [Nibricoccus sp.]
MRRQDLRRAEVAEAVFPRVSQRRAFSFEAVTNKICDDLGKALKPRSLTIISKWKARGGFTSVVTAEWSAKGVKKR